MEHTCYRCGQPVEEGVAFCENCHAPQIRVTLPSQEQVGANQPATGPMLPGTPDEVQPPARPVPFGYGAAPSQAGASGHVFRWSEAIPGAAVAGAVAAFAWIFPPLGYLLWPLTAGALGVVLYKRRFPDAVLSKGAGARIGAVTGAFGFLIFIVLAAINLAAMGGQKLRELLNEALQQAAARNPDPQAQQMMQSFMTPAGITIMFVLVSLMFLMMFVAFSSLGGMLGAKLLRRKE